MEVKQESFDPHEGGVKRESDVVSGQTEANDWYSTKQAFKNHDFVFVDTDNICKYEESEQSLNVGYIKQEVIECGVPEIKYRPLELPTKINYELVCESLRLDSTIVKKELDISGTKQGVNKCKYKSAKTESEFLTNCELPTLKSEFTDYPDCFVQPCSSKHIGRTLKTFKTTAYVSKKKRRKYPCPVCHKNFLSFNSRSKHIVGHFGKSFVVCEFCGKFMTKHNYFQHYFIHAVKNSSRKVSLKINVSTKQQHLIHANEKPFKCDICFKEFNHKSYLQQHLIIHFNEKQFKCDICSREFNHKSSLQRHLIIHNNEKLFKCDVCSKKFNHKSSLQRHLIIHTGGKSFKCDICSKTFNFNSNLQEHLKLIHIDEKPFKCDICSRRFKTKNDINLHLLFHNEKPFKCNICFKEFTRKCNLQEHLIIHTGEKPYKCDICSKEFKRKSILQEHIVIHTDEKPFKCDICSREFKLKYRLQRHLIIHTSEKPFKCEVCSKEFNQRSNFKKHVLTIHPNKKP